MTTVPDADKVPLTVKDICVVIPVLNESSRIVAAIRSASDAGQVIVVDGGSKDQTIEIVTTFDHVRLIHSQPGRGRQLATGADACERAILVFLHGDCELSEGACGKIANAINQGRIWGGMQQRISADGFRFRLLEFGNAARLKWLGMAFGDQAIFVLARIYRDVGGFEKIPLMEDVRLSKRLRKIAWPILLDARLAVDARRWRRRGVVRQTCLNWKIQLLHQFGVCPETLVEKYR